MNIILIELLNEQDKVNKELANQFEINLAKNKVDHWNEQHVVKRMDNLNVHTFTQQFLPTFQKLYDVADSDIQGGFNK